MTEFGLAPPSGVPRSDALWLVEARQQMDRLCHFAEAVNENVLGNGLAYRRDALRHVIAETRALVEDIKTREREK